jgi:hypothetical protein
MSDGQVYVLDENWRAQTGKSWRFEFERAETTDEHHYFKTTCTTEDGEKFIFVSQVSSTLLEELGVDAAARPNLLLRVVAGASLADLKVRLNAGHDTNIGNLPYCKTYTRRDRDKFARHLPR